MANFPTTFADERYVMSLDDIAPKHSMPLMVLGHSGYVVEVGLTREDRPAITEIAGQLGVREYCPNDITTRWTDDEATEKQLAKDTGRGVFLLRAIADNAIKGFGWTGEASEAERDITGMPYTFAVRLHESARGQGLAEPFSRVIVAGSMAIFRARGIGLETWASNNAAVNTYLAADANTAKVVNAARPTLDTSMPFDEKSGRHMVNDTRIYMKYNWSV